MVLLSLCTGTTETEIICRGIGTIDQNRSLSSLYPDRVFSGANQSKGKDPGEVICFSSSVRELSTAPAPHGSGEQPLTQTAEGTAAAAQEKDISFLSTEPFLSHSSPAALRLPVKSPASSLSPKGAAQALTLLEHSDQHLP